MLRVTSPASARSTQSPTSSNTFILWQPLAVNYCSAGHVAEARKELDRAIELAPSERERRQLTRRRDELDQP